MAASHPNIFAEWSPKQVRSFNPAQHAGAAAASLEGILDKGGRDLLVGLSRRTSFVKEVRVPDVAKGDVLQALRITAGQHLPLPVSEVSFDVHLLQDKNLEGRLATLLAVRSDDLKCLHSQAKEAGFRLARVVPVSWGSVLIAEKLGLANAVVVQNCDEGLAIDLVELGGLKYSRLVLGGEPDIQAEIERTCAAAGSNVSQIVAAGGLRYALASHSTEQTSLQALAAHPERLDIHLELQEALFERTRKEKENMTRSAVALSVAAVALLGAVYWDYQNKLNDMKKSQAAWQVGFRKKSSMKSLVADEANTLQDLNKRLKQSLDPGQRLGDAMVTASNLLPEGAWLTGIGAERGKPMLIRGTAKSSDIVANYVQALTDNPRFRGVQLVFANQGTLNQTNIVNFSVSAVAVGNLPLGDAGVKGK